MSRFAMFNKSKEITDISGAELDSVNSSRGGSQRRIEFSTTPFKKINVKSSRSQYDSNPYLDISHLDFTVKIILFYNIL